MAISNIQWRFAQPTEYKNINAYRDNVMQNLSGIISGVREFHDNRIDAENASLIEAEEEMEKGMQNIDERLSNIDLEIQNLDSQISTIENSLSNLENTPANNEVTDFNEDVEVI